MDLRFFHRHVFGFPLFRFQQAMANTRRSSALVRASDDEAVEKPAKRVLSEKLSLGVCWLGLRFFTHVEHLLDPPAKRIRRGAATTAVEPIFPERQSSPWKVGAHVSSAGGVENAVVNAAKIGYVYPSISSFFVLRLFHHQGQRVRDLSQVSAQMVLS